MTVKNPYLKKHLQSIGKDTAEVWESIRLADGSIQHLDFLDDKIKNVVKTFAEISPYTIIDQASVRQEYIDQAQSLNLMIPPDMPVKERKERAMYAQGRVINEEEEQYRLTNATRLCRTNEERDRCAVCEA